MTEAVFIHSGFRTGSSWLWAKFRKNGQLLAFSEIFHELLATLDGQAAASLSHKSWNSRHPVTAPYFAEFIPLLRPDGGIDGFSAEMAFNFYFPRGDRLSGEERNYIQLLLDHAAELGKVPVLSCTRTLGRMRQIKRDFGGVHILLTRDPFRQWCSYTEQAALGNSYFLDTNSRILKSAREADWFQFGGDRQDEQGFLALDEFYRHALLHLQLYGEVAGEADVIIDYDLLESETYRQEITRQIRSKCGTDVDLSDFRSSRQFSLVDLPPVGVVDEMLQSFLPSPDTMHPHVLALYEAMKSSIISYGNEAGELVSFSRGKLKELEATRAELECAATEADQVRSELERSVAELNELRRRLGKEQAELEDVRDRVAGLGNELNATADERDAIRAQLAQAQVEVQMTLGRLERALADCQEGRTLLEKARSALAGSTREHLASVERLSNERRLSEEALRREFGSTVETFRVAAVKAQVAEAALRGEFAQLQESAKSLKNDVCELRAMLQQTLSESERLHRERDAALAEAHKLARESDERNAFIGRANALIGAAVAERPDWWQRIGLALGLARPGPARMALATWTNPPSAFAAESFTDHAMHQPTETQMPAPPLFQDRNPYLRADSLADLLSWEDVNFVRCAYVTVLGRQPDPGGEAFYTARVRQGHSKLEVLWDLRRSEEGRRHDPGIAGLDRSLRNAAYARRRYLGVLVRAFSRLPGDAAWERQLRALENSVHMLASDQRAAFSALRTAVGGLASPNAGTRREQSDSLPPTAERPAAGPPGLSQRASEIFLAISRVR